MSAMLYYPAAVVTIQAIFVDPRGRREIHSWTAVPRSVEVKRNSARKADTAKVVVDVESFPVDARLLSQVHVTIHIEDAPSLSADVYATATNLRFQGLADLAETTFGDDSTVRFECRDYTAVFLAVDWRRIATPVASKAGRGLRIKLTDGETLADFVERIRVAVAPNALESRVVGTVGGKSITKRLGTTTLPIDSDANAWDILVKICDLFAHVPVWEIDPQVGAILVVRPATQLSDRNVEMAFGRNVKMLAFKRNLRRPERKQVQIVSWDPIAGRSLTAVFPPVGTAAGEDTVGKANNQELLPGRGFQAVPSTPSKPKRVQYSVEGGYSQAELDQVAELVHQEMQRSQLKGTLETFDMDDLDGRDLLALANGDRLVVNLPPEIVQDPRRVVNLPPAVRQSLAILQERHRQLSGEFAVLEATHTWSHNTGYRLSISFGSFIVGA